MDQPVAIVTGASRGIGRAIAEELARDHAVVINFARSQSAADEVVKTIHDRGGRAIAVQGDVSVAADRRRLVSRTMGDLGRLDLLVNNAGITSPGRRDLLDATEESWDLVFGINLKGPFFLSQLAAREMVRLRGEGKLEQGIIVNISSISAYAVSENRADYCIAKAGMRMMTSIFASRLAEEEIRVHEIRPGVVLSDMTAPVKEKYDGLIHDGLSPIRRWGQPEDVARAVAAIASGAFPFSTGECINVDGGFHIRRL